MQLDAVAFGAHPDDIELFCGGTLIKLGSQGRKIGVISLTQGELGTRGSPEIRSQEFQEAATVLKVSTHKMLDIPDGDVAVNWENKLKIIREIRTYQPAVVFAPYWKDRHPDHENTSNLVREAAFLSGLKKIETDQQAHRPYKVIYYPCWFDFKPSFVVNITECHDQKIKAIQAYRSQFDHPDKSEFGDDETLISRPEFLERITTRDGFHGSSIGTTFGEPFLVREPLRLDDPIGFFATSPDYA
jgi:bacillithiol biosynthesis deacetylase BshB1